MDDIVTEFMLNSCLTERRPNIRMLEAISYSHRDVVNPADYRLTEIAGSIAELYIEPVLPCISDIDMMLHGRQDIAVPGGHDIPPHLSDGYERVIGVFELRDVLLPSDPRGTHFPGYVYLTQRCVVERQNDGSYAVRNWCPHNCNIKYGNESSDDYILHGPANRELENLRSDAYFNGMSSAEYVWSIACPSWPQQASDWPVRSRNRGWPDNETIQRIVANGCAVVPVTHRHCRQHALVDLCQWRLSFSGAEVVLLNSWTPVQQIVYHMLRYFVKTERLSEQTDDNGDKLMDNYHIKTLMLWAAEMKPHKWWNDNLNLVRTCTQLLKTMAMWINDGECRHYFISPCNLIEWEQTASHSRLLVSRLQSFTDCSVFSKWFINNYICKFADTHCPCEIGALFNDCVTTQQLYRAVASVSTFSIPALHCRRFQFINVMFIYMLHSSPESERLHTFTYKFYTVAPQLCLASNAVWCLETVRRLRCSKFCVKSIDPASWLFTSAQNTSRCESNESYALVSGLNVMRCSTSQEDMSCSLRQLQTELSIAYLQLALDCRIKNGNSVATVYLAALYYSTGEYNIAMSHCRLAARPRDSKCSWSRTCDVEGNIILSIDPDIASVLGLVVLNQYVHSCALVHHHHQQQQQKQHNKQVTIFTTQLFACYLHIKCLLKLQSSEIEPLRTFQYYRESLRANVEPFITDIIMYQLLCVQLQHRTSVSSICLCQQDSINTSEQRSVLHYDTTRLRHVLILAAVELLTTFRQQQKHEFGPYGIAVPCNEFQAMLALTSGQYEQCFKLVSGQLSGNKMWDPRSLAIEPTLFPLFDDHMIALHGLLTILMPDVYGWDVASFTMVAYLAAKCWINYPATRKLISLRTVLRALLKLYSISATGTTNSLVLCFVYRQLILLRRRSTSAS